MKVIRNLKAFFKNVAGSRTAQVFFSIHLIFLLIALSKRGFLLEPLHPDNETLLLNILTVLNIPAIVAATLVCLPLALILFPLTLIDLPPRLLDDYLPALATFINFLCWQIQWAIVGYGTEGLIKRFLNRNHMK